MHQIPTQMACTTCYKIKIEDCAESVTVAGALLPDTTYTWVITDKFGHEWSDTATTDADGSFTIDLTDTMFPAGLFNQFSNLTLEVFLYETACEAATMTFCDVEYACVNFSVNPGNYVYTNRPPDDECNCQFVESVTGTAVDNTDPYNPIVNLNELAISGTPYYIAMFNAAGDNVANSPMFTIAAKELVCIRQPNGSISHAFVTKNTADENSYSIIWNDGNAALGYLDNEYFFKIVDSSNATTFIGIDKTTHEPFIKLGQSGLEDDVFIANLSGVRTGNPTGHTKKYWKLGEAEAGAPTADTKLYVEVDGVVYKIAAEEV